MVASGRRRGAPVSAHQYGPQAALRRTIQRGHASEIDITDNISLPNKTLNPDGWHLQK
jgi:hypothetical protein